MEWLLILVLICVSLMISKDFPGDPVVKNPPANARDVGLIPGLGRVPWRRKWQPTPIFLPGKSMGRGAWQAHGVTKESDMP